MSARPLNAIRRAKDIVVAAAVAAPSIDHVRQGVADALAEAADLPREFAEAASAAGCWLRAHPDPPRVGRVHKALEFAAPILPESLTPVKTGLARLCVEIERWKRIPGTRGPSPAAVAAVIAVADEALRYNERPLSDADRRLVDIFQCAPHGHRTVAGLLPILGPAPDSPPEPLREDQAPAAGPAARRQLNL